MQAKVLEQAIRRAVDSGWKHKSAFTEFMRYEDGILVLRRPNGQPCLLDAYRLIFNHDFARALWGEQTHPKFGATDMCKRCGCWGDDGWPNCYMWHLQQMVIAEDPIKYLGEHI
jgi:hypothetical protein